jgi:hypothetical protein
VYVYLFLVLSRLVLSVDMPLVPMFCFIVAHSLLVSTSKYSVYRYRTLAIECCAKVMGLQIRNGDSHHAVGQWVIVTISYIATLPCS